MSKAQPPRVSEKAVQAAIVELLEALGGKVYVLGTKRRKGDYQGTMQTPGIPDLLAFVPRPRALGTAFLFVECKASWGRLRPAQQDFRDLCAHADVNHLVGGVDVVIQWAIEAGYLVPEQ